MLQTRPVPLKWSALLREAAREGYTQIVGDLFNWKQYVVLTRNGYGPLDIDGPVQACALGAIIHQGWRHAAPEIRRQFARSSPLSAGEMMLMATGVDWRLTVPKGFAWGPQGERDDATLYWALSYMNDTRRMTFDEIADMLEEVGL